MSVEFVYRDLGAPDLARRGLRPDTASRAVLLVDLEADLVVRDGDRVVFEEGLFPVAELAYALTAWLHRPDDERGDFAFDSMSYGEVGIIRIAGSAEGWRVGSVCEPDVWSSPVAWDSLLTALRGFVDAVRRDVTALGVPPGLVPGL